MPNIAASEKDRPQVLRASLRSVIAPFVVMDVMEAAARMEREGGDVLHLEVGQPATPAPRPVIAAAERALRTERLGYTVALGIPALRERVAGYYKSAYGINIPPDRVVITPGSSGGFVLAFLAAFDAGATVAMASPGYPCYRNILTALGIKPLLITCDPQTRYQLTPEILEGLGTPIDGVIIASPSNPTGSMVSADKMRAIVSYCDCKGIRLISDEIYHGIQYAGPPTTAAAFSDRQIVVNSFSKYFSMTGWRIGWMLVPDELVRPIEKLMQNLFIATSSLSQIAAVAAFDAINELEAHVRRYATSRDLILEALPKMSITQVAPPDGAFYIYADVSHLTSDSPRFCSELLSATGVAITPGVDFDPNNGHRSIRFSYATSPDAVAEAMRRFGVFLQRGAGNAA